MLSRPWKKGELQLGKGQVLSKPEETRVITHPGHRKHTVAMRQTCTTGWLYHFANARRVGRGGKSAALISAACIDVVQRDKGAMR